MKHYDKDKLSLVYAAFKHYPNFSDRALARVTSVSPATIGRYRAVLGVPTANRIEESGRRARGREPIYRYYEEQLPDESATLYRAYNNQELLYIGASFNFMQRFAAHNNKAPWWRKVTNITTTHFDDRQDALIAERIAIRTEQPKYNIVGKTGRLLTDKMLPRARETGAVSRKTPAPPRTPEPIPTPALIRRPTGRVPV